MHCTSMFLLLLTTGKNFYAKTIKHVISDVYENWSLEVNFLSWYLHSHPCTGSVTKFIQKCHQGSQTHINLCLHFFLMIHLLHKKYLVQLRSYLNRFSYSCNHLELELNQPSGFCSMPLKYLFFALNKRSTYSS